MKVLFVSSGNSDMGISPLIKAQGDSLESLGIKVEYFLIKGKGYIGYFKNQPKLKNTIKAGKYDIVHAHFSMSGMIASLARPKNLVVSLMGWNIEKQPLKQIIKLFNFLSWDACIVKSQKVYNILNNSKVKIIPNGVNLKIFKPIDKAIALKQLGWSKDSINILFAGNPDRQIKNYPLSSEAVNLLREGRK